MEGNLVKLKTKYSDQLFQMIFDIVTEEVQSHDDDDIFTLISDLETIQSEIISFICEEFWDHKGLNLKAYLDDRGLLRK